MAESIKWLGQGISNLMDSEQIWPFASRDSSGWVSTDSGIELCRGKLLIGAEETANGYIQGHWFGYKADGTVVQFRKTTTKIQYYNTSTLLWVDTITGLTSWAEYTFARYQSLAGTFVYATWVDGVFKIHTVNPWNYATMYWPTGVYCGKSIISTGRMIMWWLPKDKTGFYGSKIDRQNSTVYTTVSGEALADTASGTLGFKAWDAKRNCFNISITDTSSGEVFTDNLLGVLTGTLGGTGTINYMTWAFTTSQSWAGTATYQWEMSNTNGITDFSYSSTRLAGEGILIPQDEGGDAIEVITIHNGAFYSIKSRSVYQLTIDDTDLVFSNIVFRKDIGVPYWRATVTTGQWVVFMNTANADKPQLTILTPNQLGDNLIPVTLAPQFDFSLYTWTACSMTTFWEYIVFSGISFNQSTNDTLFLYNFRRKTLDVLPYAAKTLQGISWLLYAGDTTTNNVYNLLSGFDDDDQEIQNYWISGDEFFNTQRLKKTKRFRIKGLITPSQTLEIYLSQDDGSFTQIGTIRGDGTYVNTAQSYTIGANGIGTAIIGGEPSNALGYAYFAELNFSTSKFRKRCVKLISRGIWFVSVDLYDDSYKLRLFEAKIPSIFRSKQNVNLAWTATDQNP